MCRMTVTQEGPPIPTACGCSGDRIGLAVGERIDKHRPEPPDEGESHRDNHDRHHDDRSGRNHRPHRHAAATDAHPREIPEVALDQSGSWHTTTSAKAIDIADPAPGLTEDIGALLRSTCPQRAGNRTDRR